MVMFVSDFDVEDFLHRREMEATARSSPDCKAQETGRKTASDAVPHRTSVRNGFPATCAALLQPGNFQSSEHSRQ
jgi:hypothetical protein